MDDYRKFVERKLAELDYLKERTNALEKREQLMALIHPEKKEALDKFFRQIEKLEQKHEVNLYVGKNKQALGMVALGWRTDPPEIVKVVKFFDKRLSNSPGTELLLTNPDEIVQIIRSILRGMSIRSIWEDGSLSQRGASPSSPVGAPVPE